MLYLMTLRVFAMVAEGNWESRLTIFISMMGRFDGEDKTLGEWDRVNGTIMRTDVINR